MSGERVPDGSRPCDGEPPATERRDHPIWIDVVAEEIAGDPACCDVQSADPSAIAGRIHLAVLSASADFLEAFRESLEAVGRFHFRL